MRIINKNVKILVLCYSISDAYYHISVHKSARRFCRFILDGVVYEYLGEFWVKFFFFDFKNIYIYSLRLTHGP